MRFATAPDSHLRDKGHLAAAVSTPKLKVPEPNKTSRTPMSTRKVAKSTRSIFFLATRDKTQKPRQWERILNLPTKEKRAREKAR
jgi:hypothetical protein